MLPPLPNTLFARDNTSWIFQGVTLNPMYWPARRQETLLTTAIYRFHPAFADASFDVWLGDLDGRPQDHGFATLEGGDVMPLGKGVVLIGMGERTSHQAVIQVAQALFKAGAADHVVAAGLPRTRSAMHLDTVFTFCRRRPRDGVRAGDRLDRAVQPAARRRRAVGDRHPPRGAGPRCPRWRRLSTSGSGWSTPAATGSA